MLGRAAKAQSSYRKLVAPHVLAQARMIREGRGGSPEYRANEHYIRQAHQLYNALMPDPEVPWAALAMHARAAARLAGYTPPAPQGEVLAAARELRNAVRTMVLAAMVRAEVQRAVAQWN